MPIRNINTARYFRQCPSTICESLSLVNASASSQTFANAYVHLNAKMTVAGGEGGISVLQVQTRPAALHWSGMS